MFAKTQNGFIMGLCRFYRINDQENLQTLNIGNILKENGQIALDGVNFH